MVQITDKIKYIGVYDKEMDLFENQYILKNGITYNSYLIDDDKKVIMDTVDKRKTEEWLSNLEKELNGSFPDYLVVSHLEPDHSGSIEAVLKKYPNLKILSNEKVFAMLPQFINIDLENRKVIVKEGDTFSTGKHVLQFIMAPMVHWPEVMLEYEQTEKILFSADAFGTFGKFDLEDNWKEEARRYYINIVGKYGMQVQNLLKKLSGAEVNKICALHGPILTKDLESYIKLYDIWSKYEPEEEGTLVVCGSLHGNTLNVCKLFSEDLKQKGEKVELIDISRTPIPDVTSLAFKYSKMIIASSTYNMSIFPAVNAFLNLLKEKNYQNRKIGIIENGSWAPNSAKCIKNTIDTMNNITLIKPIVTIKTRLDETSTKVLKELEENIIK